MEGSRGDKRSAKGTHYLMNALVPVFYQTGLSETNMPLGLFRIKLNKL